MGPINVNWDTIRIPRAYLGNKFEVDQVIAEFKRQENVGRQHDPTYELEHQFLTQFGYSDFVHRVYEVSVNLLGDPIFVGFGPKTITVGRAIRHRV